MKTVLLSILLGAVALLYFRLTSPPTPVRVTAPRASPHAAWHARALQTPHPSPHDFTPTYDSLLLAALVESDLDPLGVTLTLYSPDTTKPNDNSIVAIDAFGRVLLVSPDDAVGILALARTSLNLPPPDGWQNMWVVKRQVTCLPINHLYLAPPPSAPDRKRLKKFSVAGYSERTRELEKPVDGIKELPHALWELVGLVNEAGEGGYEARDELMLAKVRDVVKGFS